MKKTNENLIMVTSVFIMSLIVSNIIAGKVVSIAGLTIPAAVVAYAITFLCTDIINEIWGKEQANRTVKIGLYMQLTALVLIMTAIALPAASFAAEFADNFKTVLGQSWRMVAASMGAYLISQLHDVWSFQFWKKKTDGKHKWLRNNASTMASQLIDTAIFITIAFWGAVPNLLHMIISQYIVKFILAALDTPFFYFFTRKKGD